VCDWNAHGRDHGTRATQQRRLRTHSDEHPNTVKQRDAQRTGVTHVNAQQLVLCIVLNALRGSSCEKVGEKVAAVSDRYKCEAPLHLMEPGTSDTPCHPHVTECMCKPLHTHTHTHIHKVHTTALGVVAFECGLRNANAFSGMLSCPSRSRKKIGPFRPYLGTNTKKPFLWCVTAAHTHTH
jgi:hypothetical protein